VAPQPGSAVPGGTLTVGTDSNAEAQRFVATLVGTLFCGCSPSSVHNEQYGDTVVSTVALPPDLAGGIAPSWAVYRGWIIAGSSPAQVKAAVDAARSGATLATNPDYTAVMSQVGSSNNGSLFVDIQPLLGAIRATLSPAEQAQFDKDVAPNVTPLKAFGVAVHNATDHVSVDAFTLIQ